MHHVVASTAKNRPDDTRARLLAAAERILFEQGMHALTVRKVGAVSGLNCTLVTYHFGSVAGLLAELSRCNLDPMLADWAELPRPGASLDAVLSAWLSPLLRPAAFHADARALLVLDEIAAHGAPELSGPVMAAMIEISDRVRSLVAPLLPALDELTLRARLRFIAGAALGPPPRLPSPQAASMTGLEQLQAFAHAALTG